MIKKKYFGTDGIRGRVGDYPITAEFVLKLGWAVGCVLSEKGGGKVLIGKDTRISGYMFESALEAGLSAAGVNIHLLGPMPTPAIAYLTRTLRAKAGIVISASHNPYQDNGIKFFSSQGFKLPDEIELAIEQQLAKPIETVDSAKLGKAIRVVDAPGRYIEFCKSTVPAHSSFQGLKIAVDCANGATYHVAPSIYRELGAEVIEICAKPNGLNINDNCGSTKPTLLQQKVLSEKADLGIALDGDGDRVIMVDHTGEVVDGDEILYIILKQHEARGIRHKGIVGTHMTNLGFELALQEMKIDFYRASVGDRHVLAELLKRGWMLGGETSGHIVYLDVTTTGDGIISSLQVLNALHSTGLSLRDLRKGMKKYPQALINVKVNAESNMLLTHPLIKNIVQEIEHQLADRGRVLLRPSGTEPVVRVMVEGEEQGLVERCAKEIALVLEKITQG